VNLVDRHQLRKFAPICTPDAGTSRKAPSTGKLHLTHGEARIDDVAAQDAVEAPDSAVCHVFIIRRFPDIREEVIGSSPAGFRIRGPRVVVEFGLIRIFYSVQ